MSAKNRPGKIPESLFEQTRKSFSGSHAASSPVAEPFRCSRGWRPEDPEWREALARAESLGPGCTAVGTFMSPCEKACGNAAIAAGAGVAILSPASNTRLNPQPPPSRNPLHLCVSARD